MAKKTQKNRKKKIIRKIIHKIILLNYLKKK